MNTNTAPFLTKTTLEWHKGPALGGVGTAGCREDGSPLWWDGEMLLIAVELSNNDREVALVHISCDEDYFSVTDVTTGEAYGDWGPESWAWWAKIEDATLPPKTIR